MSAPKPLNVRIMPEDLSELRMLEGLRRQEYVDDLADEYQLPTLEEDGGQYDIDEDGNFVLIEDDEQTDGEP